MLARNSQAAGLIAAIVLAACASKGPPDNAPTIKTLSKRVYSVPPDAGVAANDEATIAAYREYLKKAPQDAQRPEAMRRLGDLELDNADARLASGAPTPAETAPAPPPQPAAEPASNGAASAATPASASAAPTVADGAKATPGDKGSARGATGQIAEPVPAPAAASAEARNYRAAVTMYLDLLKAYPKAPDNDKVLYQLAHAYELGGKLEDALKALNRLVAEYPDTAYRDEAQFRRGELMFAQHNYPGAQQAYEIVLKAPEHTPFYERALYMRGWTLYKQDRLEDALESFFGVLDLKLIAREGETELDAVAGLTRADRELVEDTLRVVSLSLENLQGAASIPEYMRSALRRDYEFRVYQQLGELYLSQERIKDAADTFLAFSVRNPKHNQAPVLRARVIEMYHQAGFDNLEIAAKREYVSLYGLHGAFRKANRTAWQQTLPRLKSYLAELARRDHAKAQKTHKDEDYDAAAALYRQFLEAFPRDPESPEANFLLAEVLFEEFHYGPAAVEYEKTAYGYLPHPKSADAGYAALLAYVQQEKYSADAERDGITHLAAESALRFANAFPKDPRTGAVLSDAAERLYRVHDYDRAISFAQRTLALDPPADAARQRTAWTVAGLAAFDSGAFDQAERAYTELLARTPAGDPQRPALVERLAASVYKQGEQARAQGRLADAVANFNRVSTVAPSSPVRVAAHYDAATVLIEMHDWPAAARSLEDFRQRYPKDPLAEQAGEKLALVYSESAQWALAAGELERVAASKTDEKVSRSALWQAAELYEKAGRPAQGAGAGAGAASASTEASMQALASAARVYERYVQMYPLPLEPAIEARSRLARLGAEQGDTARSIAWMRQLVQAEQAGGTGRTDRTRYLGANAALALAQGPYDDFHKVALVEPLKKQLALKKARMETVLKAYATAADYGVAEVSTAATYHTAEVYHEFGQALMASERPKGLSAEELEQYNVLLEEQSFPFEEKAIAMHEANVHHSAEGIYDQWIKSSFAALAQLRPLRYGKAETSEDSIDAIR